MTICGLKKLLVILGGRVDQEYRQLIENTLTQAMSEGDTMHNVTDESGLAPAAQEGDLQEWIASKRQAVAILREELEVREKIVAKIKEENDEIAKKVQNLIEAAKLERELLLCAPAAGAPARQI